MEDKLQEILNDHAETLERYQHEHDKLISKMAFYIEHKLEEEERVSRIKYDAVSQLVYNYKIMHREIQDILNKWNS